jgi:hypothetical protein
MKIHLRRTDSDITEVVEANDEGVLVVPPGTWTFLGGELVTPPGIQLLLDSRK